MNDNNNPYRAPQTNVELDEQPPVIPARTLNGIRMAWIAAIISGVITLIVTVAAISTNRDVMGFNAFNLLDVALIFGLAFGIYRKSRACAAIMLVYFVISKAMLFVEGYISPFGILITALFLYAYIRGVAGTCAYHRQMKETPYLTYH